MTRPLGALTDAQRRAKLARALKAAELAAALLDELYADRQDQSYRLSCEQSEQHVAIARAATAAETALAKAREVTL